MNTFWIILIILVSLYLLIGIVAWLWFAYDETKTYRNITRKEKLQTYWGTFPFVFMWAIILIAIISDN
jgi:hypothetical protein